MALHERAGDSHPLLFAAGELGGALIDAVGEPDFLEDVERPRAALRTRHAGVLGGEHHVLQRGARRYQAVALEDEAHLARADFVEGAVLELGDVAPVEHHVARGGSCQAADDVEQRRLARARRPHHREELAVAHLEVGAPKRVDNVALAHVEQLLDTLHGYGCMSSPYS